jgi:GAF domain-containing protein
MSEPEEEDKTERLLQQIAIFTDVARAMASSLDLEWTLQTVMDGLAEFFLPTGWSLLRVDEPKNELYFVITDGDTPAPIKKMRLKIGEGVAGWVAQHDESLIVPDVSSDPRFANRLEEMAKWNTRSIICVPLHARKRVLGVIQLINSAEESFNEQEMFFLHAICDYAAIAIDYKS